MNQEMKQHIKDLVERGAIFYVSHSGGKDSQAMTIEIERLVPADQIVIIHAHLPEVEWKGTRKHIAETIGELRYIECEAKKTFFQMVDHRQMFPGPQYRQCTSDLKRGPIQKAIRNDLKELGKFLAVNCMGLRAEESPARAKKNPFAFDKSMSKAGREIYNMLPIHDYKLKDVWASIRSARQTPHWAYSKGMERLSCCFCIMASTNDLQIAAIENQELYAKYVRKEQELNFTLQEGHTLEELTGIYLEADGISIDIPVAVVGSRDETCDNWV